MIRKGKINPLNVLDIRRTEFCPPYFETISVTFSYNLLKALNDWIYDNISGRYYIGQTVELVDDDSQFKNKIKVGFENPGDMSYFMLACPLLKYK